MKTKLKGHKRLLQLIRMQRKVLASKPLTFGPFIDRRLVDAK